MDLSRPQVMGVLNVTPDSFSDGGKFNQQESALRQALEMIEQGATIIDIGGESTRPGAAKVSEQEELDRVMPVVRQVRENSDVYISLDTSTPAVMSEGLSQGVAMVNDVRAFQRAGAIEAVRDSDALLCVMHMQGEPDSMQDAPTYGGVVEDVKAFLRERVCVLQAAGVQHSRVVLDPGFGFGKTLEHNFSLLKHLNEFEQLGVPVLVGMSRKSMIGGILNKPVEERLVGSVAAALLALERGASILRVHDVAPTMDALKIWSATQAAT